MPRSITSSPARRFWYLQGVDPREQVRRQPLDAVGHFDLKRGRVVDRIVGFVFVTHGVFSLSPTRTGPGQATGQSRKMEDGGYGGHHHDLG